MMKKWMSLLMALCLLMTGAALAEGDMADAIAIPEVYIDWGTDGALLNQSNTGNAYLRTYAVDGNSVYLIEYLGEYLCDGVFQSMAFELPENTLLMEDENGIRQRKTYDYTAFGQTGDVTVIWHNGCTIALVVCVKNEIYQAGLGDQITGWLQSMTIDGVKVMPENAENESADEGAALPVLVAQLGQAAEMVELDERGDEYLEVLDVNGITVIMGRFLGELSADGLGCQMDEEIHDGEPLEANNGLIAERAVFLSGEGDQTMAMDISVIHMDGYTYGFVAVVEEKLYAENRDLIDFWAETLDVFDGSVGGEEVSSEEEAMLLVDHPLYYEADWLNSDADALILSAAGGKVNIGEYAIPAAEVAADDVPVMLMNAALRVHEDISDFDFEETDVDGFAGHICHWNSADARGKALIVTVADQVLMLSATAAAEDFAEYEAQIDEMLAGCGVYVDGFAPDAADIMAEELGFAMFGEYAEFWYVGDQQITSEMCCVYEFIDEEGSPVGVIAVCEETGSAYVSYGTDALNAEYEFIETLDSVG